MSIDAQPPGAGRDVGPEDVLRFWFSEIPRDRWFATDPALDETIRRRFGGVLAQALRGELVDWRRTNRGLLAEVIVLDQFSRNVHRGTAAAFGGDDAALALARQAVARGALEELDADERTFLLMPYMHSESPAVHVDAERLFRAYAPAVNAEYERRHKAIVDRFGRYPHRNAVLGRESTADELAFLQQPGSSF